MVDRDRAGELIEAAGRWANLGVSAVPAWPRSKVVSLHWRDYEKKRPSEFQLRSWFESGLSNLALVCGTGNELGRLLVLDFDDLDHALVFASKAGSLYKTYTESTGRGLHLFYLVDHPQTKRFIEAEALGLGHLCLVSPSIHPSGSAYKEISGSGHELLRVEASALFSLLSEAKPLRNDRPISSPGASGVITQGGTLARIKAHYSIVEQASKLTELKPSGRGRYYLGHCPFHEDRQPSFWVDADKGLWGCFSSSCIGHRGGDVINLLALAKGLNIGEAIRQLAKEMPC